MNVGVAYADMRQQVWLRLEVPEGSTVQQAIELSGILAKVPSIDLDKQKIGIYGKTAKLTAVLQEYDRVEIYRGIIANPDDYKDGDDDDDDD
ncbi:RnfH family protein [Candidatus Albibeggiatoa sp. nov. BB20]|uniref:RnfH family protein n=1 Tax=Candidatus Albibeggiatoa sp. nov. BB20 TaxID=3162723 RepID=UPI00336533B6